MKGPRPGRKAKKNRAVKQCARPRAAPKRGLAQQRASASTTLHRNSKLASLKARRRQFCLAEKERLYSILQARFCPRTALRERSGPPARKVKSPTCERRLVNPRNFRLSLSVQLHAAAGQATIRKLRASAPSQLPRALLNLERQNDSELNCHRLTVEI